jgi:hypothetical protein
MGPIMAAHEAKNSREPSDHLNAKNSDQQHILDLKGCGRCPRSIMHRE